MEKPTLRCLVDNFAVDVPVCWSAAELELVREKWPDGVDVAVISLPAYQGMGNLKQRQWLATAARRLLVKQGVISIGPGDLERMKAQGLERFREMVDGFAAEGGEQQPRIDGEAAELEQSERAETEPPPAYEPPKVDVIGPISDDEHRELRERFEAQKDKPPQPTAARKRKKRK